MGKTDRSLNLFPSIETLGQYEISFDVLYKAFGGDKRYPETLIRSFIKNNQESFDYLEIVPSVKQENYRFSLVLNTSKYIGVVPIFSPTHTPVCDLSVTGRFNEEAGELIPLLGSYISPKYSSLLQLVGTSQLHPPVFYECCRFVDKYLEAKRYRWLKFSAISRVEKAPSSGTDWQRYALDSAKDPMTINSFSNRRNILSLEHKEWQQLNYVLLMAMDRLSSFQTPARVRAQYEEKISILSQDVRKENSSMTDVLMIHSSDPTVIKELKTIGNLILQEKVNQFRAWKLDHAEFFERYVQYLFDSVARRKMASSFSNVRYPVSSSSKPSWGLSYLEPDIIIQQGENQFVIDAKYKSHLFNWNSDSEGLNDIFRQDLHQIIAYSSFSQAEKKSVVLVYPFSNFFHRSQNVRSILNRTSVTVNFVGLPMDRNRLEETIENLSRVIVFQDDNSAITESI